MRVVTWGCLLASIALVGLHAATGKHLLAVAMGLTAVTLVLNLLAERP